MLIPEALLPMSDSVANFKKNNDGNAENPSSTANVMDIVTKSKIVVPMHKIEAVIPMLRPKAVLPMSGTVLPN